MIYIGVVLYLVLLGFLLYQDYMLGRMFQSRAWAWEIAGISVAFGGLIVRMVLVYFFNVPRPWLTMLALLAGIIPLACLIMSRHLIRKEWDHIFDTKPPR
jgi:hypothetical protein